MKTLLLLRHAKSSWDDDSLTDHDRPLAPRGRRAAPLMARYMVENDHLPDLVLCSTSTRTRQTWAGVEDELAAEIPTEFVEELYLAGPGRMLRLLQHHGGDADVVLMIGHNPGSHELALALPDADRDRRVEKMYRKFPTAALAVIEFDVEDWADVVPGMGSLISFTRPKDLS